MGNLVLNEIIRLERLKNLLNRENRFLQLELPIPEYLKPEPPSEEESTTVIILDL